MVPRQGDQIKKLLAREGIRSQAPALASGGLLPKPAIRDTVEESEV